MTDTNSRKDKIRQLLLNQPPVADQASRNAAQDTYNKKLLADIERTRSFLLQAKEAIIKLNEEIAQKPSNWDDETRQKARIIALHDSYKKLPYMAMKNDLIGIATAASLTKKAVHEHREASLDYAEENRAIHRRTRKQSQLLADFKEIDVLLRQRIAAHPERMAKIEAKLQESQPVGTELERQLALVHEAATVVKAVEERLYQHVKRVVTKLYASQDWENASIMDEQTFKTSIVLSISTIVTLVTNSLSPGDKWTLVTPGGPEEKLVLVMVRNNLVLMRDNHEVKLREFGFDD